MVTGVDVPSVAEGVEAWDIYMFGSFNTVAWEVWLWCQLIPQMTKACDSKVVPWGNYGRT